MACRFFLGISEAGFGPGIPYLLSFFYLRHEVGYAHFELTLLHVVPNVEPQHIFREQIMPLLPTHIPSVQALIFNKQCSLRKAYVSPSFSLPLL